MTLPIAILETGAPPAALQPDFGCYPDMFAELLGDGFRTETFDVRQGEAPADPSAFAGMIVTGSAAGVYEPEPWIAPLLDTLRAARGRTRLVGVCFGHQAMAQAFGGQVKKVAKGWSIGLHRYTVTQAEPWMAPRAAALSIPASHQDQVVVPPPGARVILASDFTPYAGLAWDDDAVSFQPHPEFDPAFAAALVESRRGRSYSDSQADAAVASLKQPNDRALLGGWIRKFLGG